MKDFNFNDLFIFEMANNHQGETDHGVNVIRTFGALSKKLEVRSALKLQFRQLDTFIHPDYKTRKDLKHIPRFLETRLPKEDFAKLIQATHEQGMVSMCTPFDEESVDWILDLGIQLIKIGSCSAADKPLIERAVEAGKPMIVSTAGLTMNQIDRLVSFLQHKGVHFAVMHCVALYPTLSNKLNLNQIELLKTRFPDVPIGFSTHEEPGNFSAIRVAYAKGARLFERHVGLETDKHKLNTYSSTPAQIEHWISAWKETVDACGGEQRGPSAPQEMESLKSLMRGVFVKHPIKKGDLLRREDVFFAMPLLDGQLFSGDWVGNLLADRDYQKNEALSHHLSETETPKEDLIYQILLQVRGMLNKARVAIGVDSSIEISHHYGLDKFREFGAVIVECINRSYCKKLVIQLPRQKHPYHYHKKKEETFQLLYGDMEVELDGHRIKMKVGDTLLIRPNQWHKFHTLDGAIVEEVSTTHYNDDSYYEDEKIAHLPREKRKTQIPNWEKAVQEHL